MTLAPVLARLHEFGAHTISIGASRDGEHRAAAAGVARQWQDAGGTVLAVVDWPENAASWLRQARRLTAGNPDAWVVFATGAGWAGMRTRLAEQPGWDEARVVRVLL